MDARSSYREAAVRGATPIQLVVFLYEQAIADLRRATVAMESGDVELRTGAINHALTVIGQLQASLDLERGQEVATNLQQFYGLVRAGLIDAQSKQSIKILGQQIDHLMLVREAWLEVERATARPRLQSAESAHSTSGIRLETPLSDWNA